MKIEHLRILLILLLVVIGTFGIYGQDIHFSQFSNAPLHLNPALTGAFRGDFRFNTSYRRQWPSVPVEYETITGSIDYNFCTTCSDFGPYSLGAVFTNDAAGFSRLSLTQFALSGAIRRSLFQRHEMSFGLMLGIGQQRFDTGDLFSGANLGGNGFMPTLDDDFNNLQNTFFDVSAGVNTRWNGKDPRSYFDLGAGFFHINRYNTSFTDDLTEKQFIRSTIYGMGSVKVADRVDLIYQGLASFVGSQDEWQLGMGARIYVLGESYFWKGFGFQVVGSYKNQDAFIPSAGLFYRAWFLGFSYDINTSGFNIATNQRGGPEFTLSYIFRRISVPIKRICPIHL